MMHHDPLLKLRRALKGSGTGNRVPVTVEYPLRKFKPVHIFSDRLVSSSETSILREALEIVLEKAQVKGILPIEVFGSWYRDSREFGSTEWYIKQAFDSKRKQCDTHKLLDLFKKEPWQKEVPHYDVLLLSAYDLYDSAVPEIKFFTGWGSPDATLISFFRCRRQGLEAMKQAGIHEFGHTFGSPPHCENKCSMRSQSHTGDLAIHSRDRLKLGAFCSSCESRIKNAFWKLPGYYQQIPEVLEILDRLTAREPEILEKVKNGEVAKIEVTIDWN